VYNHPLGRLPKTLQELVILRDDDYMTYQYTHWLEPLPVGLKVLKVTNVTCITDSIDNFVLPQGLQVLHVGMLRRSIGPLPPALQVLHIDSIDYNTPLDTLPATLIELDITRAHNFQQSLIGVLPSTLKLLVVSGFYSAQLPSVQAHTDIVRKFHCSHQQLLEKAVLARIEREGNDALAAAAAAAANIDN
jgi:hypothetical protein